MKTLKIQLELHPFTLRNFRRRSRLQWTASVWKDNERIAVVSFNHSARFQTTEHSVDGLLICANRPFSNQERDEILVLGTYKNELFMSGSRIESRQSQWEENDDGGSNAFYYLNSIAHRELRPSQVPVLPLR